MPDSDAELRHRHLQTLELAPVGPQGGFVRGSWTSLRDIAAFHELLVLLVKRELRARYKDSSLGFVWSLAKPVAQLLIYFVVLGQFLGMARGIPEFAVFVFSGLTMWSLFNEIVAGGTGAIVANAGLIKKVYVPREIFPLSTAGGAFVNFAIQFGVLLISTIAVRSVPVFPNALYVPGAIILMAVFATALALVLSACNVYLRDIQHLIEIVMLLLFWASPIVYSFSYVHKVLEGNWIEQIYLANPVTVAVLAFQRGMWTAGANSTFPPGMPQRLIITIAISVGLLWLSQRIFSRLEGNFAQEL